MLKTLLDGNFPDDLKCCLSERPVIPTSEMDYEEIDVPGRNGSLYIEKGYKDIDIVCAYNVLELYNIKALVRQIKAFFVGKKRLQFSDDADFFYKVKKVIFSDVENDIELFGGFTVTFVCAPFQYQLNTSFDLSRSGQLVNPGSFESLPYLKVYGSGTLTINGTNIVLKDVTDYIEIDCDLGNAYKGSVDMNRHMTGVFPVFKVGVNMISWSGQISRVTGEGRWCYL